MAIILNMWETLISTTLNPSKEKLNLLSAEAIASLVNQSETEQETVKSLLIEGIIDRPKIKDKQQFVQINQAMLIRLLDKLHSYKQATDINEILNLYDIIIEHLKGALDFIEDFFSNYFDRNEKVPAPYLIIAIEELCRQLEDLRNSLALNKQIDKVLSEILISNFSRFCTKATAVTYNELMYQKDLMNELLTDETLDSERSIREVLFYFNFNDDSFVAYLFRSFSALTDELSSKAEKITALRYEQKSINQLAVRLNMFLTPFMPSLKEQINQWIEEEIKFMEGEQTIAQPDKSADESVEKIHTSLSVAKLALLIRLMILDKIITNRVVAHVLRIYVKTTATLHQENISFGSLETKYHNPDRGTIAAIKDMLFRWINIVNKL